MTFYIKSHHKLECSIEVKVNAYKSKTTASFLIPVNINPRKLGSNIPLFHK